MQCKYHHDVMFGASPAVRTRGLRRASGVDAAPGAITLDADDLALAIEYVPGASLWSLSCVCIS
jgi:hypothetical protein